MERAIKYFLKFIFISLVATLVWGARPASPAMPAPPRTLAPPDSLNDSISLPYPIPQQSYPFTGPPATTPLHLADPPNIKNSVQYDPENNAYLFTRTMGNRNLGGADMMTFEEYLKYDMDRSMRNYWKSRIQASGTESRSALIPQLHVAGEAFDRIFGGSTIDIRPSGAAELRFGVIANRRDDPTLDVRQRRTVNFDFQETIQMNVVAKIGDKIEFTTNYNTEATFDFENKLKLQYQGQEDEIIKLIEAGDVTLPLNSTLITGSQSLFGIKTRLQFGRLMVTSVFSQQKSESSTITVAGGAQTNTFNLGADDYEENKHFFLAQFFRENYERYLSTLPIIGSPVNITKIEVWLTNIGAAVTENRNIVAFQDLGEIAPYNNSVSPIPGLAYPSNRSNDLITRLDTNQVRPIDQVGNYLKNQFGFTSGIDFQKVESARKLNSSEYSFNSKLGFISLNTTLNPDQVLAVAFQYTVIGLDTVFQVGEFSDQGITGANTLITKMLKSTTLSTRVPMWNLMMKNVYAIGAYQVNQEDFVLNILYSGNENGVPTGFLTEGPDDVKGIPLIRLMNLDNLDARLNPPHDGVFDFIDGAARNGGTINAANGRIYFPVLEPFGSWLRNKLKDPALADKYAFDSLYTLTKTGARQFPSKNKFALEGFYKSSSGSEIALNALNVPQGSVRVTAGGIPLTENVDYTVDYTLGRVRIINEGILNSGTPINISLESNSLFNIQTKTLLGTHFDYQFNKDLRVGATILNLTERPLTQKVNFGDEPISNTIWGMDFSYQRESRFVTKVLDKLPFYSTKVPTRINLEGEFAHFIPGHSRAIGKTGISYIDDFEGAKSTYDLKNMGLWFLASTPQGQVEDLFPEAAPNTGLEYGFNRAKLAWYVIDPLFYDKRGNLKPPNISNDEISNHYVRNVFENEVFPNKEPQNGQPMNIAVFNMAFYPTERGPYNYDVNKTLFSEGINADGTLKRPDSRWGGIMRKIDATDFEATNVEYIEFWMMDPFAYDTNHSGGSLYFNLGDISEDILRDSRKSFENGLPTTADATGLVDTTVWGRVPNTQDIVGAFDNNPAARAFQDVGYDGLRTDDEVSFFDTSFLQRIIQEHGANSPAYLQAINDPSSDNYHYFRGTNLDNDPKYASILERYKRFNGPDGNSPTNDQNPESYPTLATTLPNAEDINRDNTLSEDEKYYQYRIDLRPDRMRVGLNHITDVYHAKDIPLANGKTGDVKWYQFKIPIRSPEKVVGNIEGFKSIRFIRAFFRDFEQPIVCRFATFELVRGDWRKYTYDLLSPGEYIPNDNQTLTSFDVSTVSIEENGEKIPVPYVLPPDIEREVNLGTTNLQQLNEQAMVLKVCNLEDGDARAAYKTADFDFRQYKKLKMFIHAEKSVGNLIDDNATRYADGALSVFIRIGADFDQNYYEYEIPLVFTDWFEKNEDAIWPRRNNLDLELAKLVDAKQSRHKARREPNSTMTYSTPYITYDGDRRITVVGAPSLSDVRAIMIGVRNPKRNNLNPGNDDGLSKCAEIWVNELRLTDFDESSGWAATARMNAMLADLGNVVLSGLHSTPGFGSIEKKVNERAMETTTQFDFATNLELGKFFPEKLGLKVPMHFDYSETRISPKYNPLDPDIPFKEDLRETYDTKAERDSVRALAQDFTRRKNLNFINVRREKVGAGGKNRIYGIENFDFTYAYSEIYHRNIDIEYDFKKTYRGGLGYNFTNNPKNVRPFQRWKLVSKSPALRLIRDFNFFYAPKLISFRTDLNREYSEKLLRNKSQALVILEPTYLKKFDWRRIYDVKFDLTQALRVDFVANANAYVDEPPGVIDRNAPDYTMMRDSIWESIMNGGRMQNYNQSLNVNYNVPINKLPLLGWTNASIRYGADYRWTASAISVQEILGNTVENAVNKQANLNFNFTTLYNKVPFLKDLNAPPSRPGQQPGRPAASREQPATGKEPAPADEGEEKPKVNYGIEALKVVGRIVTGVKNASISYTEGAGTVLPGFMPEPDFFGNNWSLDAPGLGFILGSQADIRPTAVTNNWLTRDTLLNTAYMTKINQTLNARATIEPLPDLRIELTANRNYAENHQEYFTANADGVFTATAAQTTGSFSISFITWNTAFEKQGDDHKSQNFQNLKDYRQQIAFRLAGLNPNWDGTIVDSTGFPQGYGPTSQEVLIPSFIAAYTGRSPDVIGLETFPRIPIPNWRITYGGLSRIPFLSKFLKSLNISHSYRSTYNIGAFQTNILYKEAGDYPLATNDINNFIPKFEIGQVSINEQFAPLINFDMQWHNSLLSRVEIKKSRSLSLSFVNNQLTEVISNEFILSMGYRFKDVQFTITPLGGGGRKQRLKSDLNIKADVTIRTNKTVLRRVDEDVEQVSSGQRNIGIKTSAEYRINERVEMRLYYEQNILNPFISSQFPNSTTNAGISLRFSLAQ